MIESRSTRPITLTQVVGVMALAIIVFFIVAFASKAISTYRLRAWRDDLRTEIASMELDRQGLVLETMRRRTTAWVDEALKETGQVPPGVISVRLVPPENGQQAGEVLAQQTEPGATITERLQGLSFFDNANWRAWLQLLQGRD
jgi:hypothetical protein